MTKKIISIIVAVFIGLIFTKSTAAISNTSTEYNIVIPNDLREFLLDMKHATSKDLLSSLTSDGTSNMPTATDWETATTFMYKYKEDVLFELIDVYPSLPINGNKVLIHNAVMNVLEGNKADKRILMLFDISQNKNILACART